MYEVIQNRSQEIKLMLNLGKTMPLNLSRLQNFQSSDTKGK